MSYRTDKMAKRQPQEAPMMFGLHEIAGFIVRADCLTESPGVFDRLLARLKSLGFRPLGICHEGWQEDSQMRGVDLKVVLGKPDWAHFYFSVKLGDEEQVAKVSFHKNEEYANVDLTVSEDALGDHGAPIKKAAVQDFFRISKELYYFLKPIYGSIAEEDEAPSFDEVLSGVSTLPLFWGFYSPKLVDALGRDELLAIAKKGVAYEELRDGGLFFGLAPWDLSYADDERFTSRMEELKGLVSRKLNILAKNKEDIVNSK